MEQALSPALPDVLRDHLARRLAAMTEAMVAGDAAAVAQAYADNAVLTDVQRFRVEGRAAIEAHWATLPRYKEWRLVPLETGGDVPMPYQRLHSLARMDIKGREYVDEGYCFVVWQQQRDGDYRIYVDIYSPLRFGPEGPA